MFTILLLVLTVLQAPRNNTIQGSSHMIQSPVVSLQADDTTIVGMPVSGGNLYSQNAMTSGSTISIATVPDNRTIVVK